MTKKKENHQVYASQFEYRGKTYTCRMLSELPTGEPRPTRKQVYNRYRSMGSPLELTDDQFNRLSAPLRPWDAPRGSIETAKVFTVMPDNIKMSAREIQKMFGIPETTIQSRRNGPKKQTVFTRLELEEIARAHKLGRHHTKQLMGNLDGDLALLSDTENTGAGKGEIPDEIWCNRKFNYSRSIAEYQCDYQR